MFYKLHSQMFAKTILNNWIKDTFRNENSLFFKQVKAKERYRLRLKKKALTGLNTKLKAEKDLQSGLQILKRKSANKLLRKAFTSLLRYKLEQQGKKKFETLSSVFKAWGGLVSAKKEEAQFDLYLKEQEDLSRNPEIPEIEQKKRKNDRFLNILFPEGFGSHPDNQPKDRQNLTEMSSYDGGVDEDIVIKSAM